MSKQKDWTKELEDHQKKHKGKSKKAKVVRVYPHNNDPEYDNSYLVTTNQEEE